MEGMLTAIKDTEADIKDCSRLKSLKLNSAESH